MYARSNPTAVTVFLIAYTALIAIGSLYPFTGWKPLGAWSLEFLAAPLPRYITRIDLSTNLLVYVPLGYALALRFFSPGRHASHLAFAWLLGSGLSLALESLQQLLPGRFASNLDIALNSLGVLIGGLLVLHHSRWLRAWRVMRRWRQAWFQPHGRATLGLWLLLLWGFSQFSLLPFPGVGWLDLHLRPIDMPPARLGQLNGAWFFAMFLEIGAVGMFTACLLKPGRYASAIFLLILAAFALKLMAAAALLKLRVIGGILSLETLAAFLAALWLLIMPSVSRRRLGIAVGLLAVIVLGRLVFLPSPLWPSGSLLNLVGLAAHVAALWPLLALAYLLPRLVAARGRRRPPG